MFYLMRLDKKTFNNDLNYINGEHKKKNGMNIEKNENDENEYNGKDFAKNKVAFNLYDSIK